MLLARSPGAATLRAPALAIRAAAFLALVAESTASRGLARALADSRQTPDAIRGYLEHVGQDGGPPAFEGVAGRAAFDSNGDPVNKQFTLGAVQGGRIVPPTEAR